MCVNPLDQIQIMSNVHQQAYLCAFTTPMNTNPNTYNTHPTQTQAHSPVSTASTHNSPMSSTMTNNTRASICTHKQAIFLHLQTALNTYPHTFVRPCAHPGFLTPRNSPTSNHLHPCAHGPRELIHTHPITQIDAPVHTTQQSHTNHVKLTTSTNPHTNPQRQYLCILSINFKKILTCSHGH